MSQLPLILTAALVVTLPLRAEQSLKGWLETRPEAPSGDEEIVLTVHADANAALCDAKLALAAFTPESPAIDVHHAVILKDVSCPAVESPVTVEFRLGRLSPGTHTIRLWGAAYASDAEIRDSLSLTVREGSSQRLLLGGGRFEARVSWRDFAGRTGVGYVAPGGLRDGGLFWFFSPDNPELLLKLLDGCVVNRHLWVLGAGATNVAFTIEILDTVTGQTWTYSNELGQPAGSFFDTDAFPEACS